MIPGFQDLMLPLLELAKDGEEHSFKDAVDELAKQLDLTPEERSKLLPSGTDRVFRNRVGWAKTHLKKAGLLTYPKRGYFKITDRGREVLEKNLDRIDIKYLDRFKEFQEFRKSSQVEEDEDGFEELEEYTPEDLIEMGYKNYIDSLANELLDKVKESPWEFFEDLVVDLLVKMGYGGSIKDAGRSIGGVGDEGIDGVIKQDILGLDVIYIQAKKWENTITRPEVQKFAGALQGMNAVKGVFITTSNFSNNAKDYAESITSKVILINGEELAKLMIEHGVGVSVKSLYQIKDIDNDYFLGE